MDKLRGVLLVVVFYISGNISSYSLEYATIPYSTDFNSGLDKFWTTFINTQNGQIITDSCILWNSWGNNDTTIISASFHFVKSLGSNTEISFKYSNNGNENRYDFVYLSTDHGKNFYKIFDFYEVGTDKRAVSLNLKYWINYLNIVDNDSLIIKFEHKAYNYSDYLVIDDFSVTVNSSSSGFNELTFPVVFDRDTKIFTGDYDNDGDLDILFVYPNLPLGTGYNCRIYKNKGNKTFEELLLPINEHIVPYWEDFNNDGYLDLLYNNANSNGIFINAGNDQYVEVPISYENETWTNATFCDFDNDGDKELLITGTKSNDDPITRLFSKNENGFYIELQTNIPPVKSESLQIIDCDNDMDFDLLLTGIDKSGNTFNSIYINDRMKFTRMDFESYADFRNTGNWIDINADGFFDAIVAITIDGNGNFSGKLYKNYKNNDFREVNVGLPARFDERMTIGDINLDGFDDLAITGRDASANYHFNVYLNDKNEGLIDLGFPDDKQVYGGVEFADIDSDGDLDIICLEGSVSSIMKIYENLLNPTVIKPACPSNLKCKVIGQNASLSWEDLGISENGLRPNSYNLRIGTSPNGFDIVNPTSNINSGYLTLPGNGNCSKNLTWQIKNLKPGNYFWSVQTVDNAYRASEFATEKSFTIPPLFSELDIGIPLLNYYSSVSSIDFDNDSDMDLYFTGLTYYKSEFVNYLFRNDGNLNFSRINCPFPPLTAASVIWVDSDNDNALDLILIGQDSSSQFKSFFFKNNGTGMFTQLSSTIPAHEYPHADIGDFNNDGKIDLALTGGSAQLYTNIGNQFISKKITDQDTRMGSAKFIDVNNDNKMDLILSGNNRFPKTYLYLNNGDSFPSIQLSTKGFSYSSIGEGDYNNDGLLDFIISGKDLDQKNLSLIYKNSGNSNFETIQTVVRDFSHGNCRFFDYDNDGDEDLFMYGLSNNTVAKIYINEENDYTEIDPLINTYPLYYPLALLGVTSADLDNDGDLDFVIGNKLYINNGNWPNDPPGPPSNLRTERAGYGIKFNWDSATDKQSDNKSLSYNLRIGTKSGGVDIMTSMSDITSGYHKIPCMGNVQLNLGWRLDSLPEGKYYWSVQAIDQGFMGGVWAPEQTFTISVIRADFSTSEACLGSATQFEDKSLTSGTSITKWKWDFGDGSISEIQNPSHIYLSAGKYNVKLVVASQDYIDSTNLIVIVKQSPKARFNADPVCHGLSTIFQNTTIVYDLNIMNWNWALGDGQSSSEKDPPSHFYAKPGNYTAKLTSTADNGCFDTISKVVKVGEYPVALLSASGPTEFCSGGNVVLSVGKNNYYSYQWKFNDLAITDSTSDRLTAIYSGEYSVEVNNKIANCVSNSQKATVAVIEKPVRPVIKNISSVSGICPGDQNIDLEVEQSTSAYTYQWKLNGVPIDDANSSKITKVVKPGNYSLMASIKSCSAESDPFVLKFLDTYEKPEIMAKGPTVWYLKCSNDSVKNINWFYNGNLIQEAKNKTFYVANQKTGQYYVELTNESGCKTKSDVITIPIGVTGIEDPDPFSGLKIYPNPTPGVFTIEMDNNIFGDLLIDILNQTGSKVLNIKFDKTTEHFMSQIDLSGQSKGMYIINLAIKEYKASRKLIVE